MKRFIILSLVTACSLCGYAQFKTFEISESGLLYIIPSYMTKEGKQIIYSCGNNWDGYTVYDQDFNIIKKYKHPSNNSSIQAREIKYTRLIDPDTKEFLSDWIVESDVTQDNPIGRGGVNIFICSEKGSYASLGFFLSQTLFDEDEDFEFIRSKNEVIPITTKREDYIKEHSSGINNNEPQYSPDEWWREYGAESYELFWDYQKGKEYGKLIKIERYGGAYFSGVEIVNLDGVVEQTIDGIKSGVYEGYHVNGDFFIKRQGDTVVYRLNSHKLPEVNVRGVNYDLNRDGKVNAADHVNLSNRIMNK